MNNQIKANMDTTQDALNVRQVTKRFKVQKPPFWERWLGLNGARQAPGEGEDTTRREVVAVKNVSLDVHRGEIYG
ncbi:MAG: hypothetical protein JXN59_01975, partial [Anaerolineae bacterium]|nr:hypothetical protein [Anaerolineae bacterium]